MENMKTVTQLIGRVAILLAILVIAYLLIYRGVIPVHIKLGDWEIEFATPQPPLQPPQAVAAAPTAPNAATSRATPSPKALSPTVASPTQAEQRLVISYDGRGTYERTGVSLWPAPVRSAFEPPTLYPPTEVLILDGPFYSRNDPERLIWWRVKSEKYGEGYVADLVKANLYSDVKLRLVKPKLAKGDVVRVSIPGGMNWRDDQCEAKSNLLNYNDQLTIVTDPQHKCNDRFPCEECDWWYVRTVGGLTSWVADVSSTNKDVLIAPQWYIDAMSNIPLR